MLLNWNISRSLEFVLKGRESDVSGGDCSRFRDRNAGEALEFKHACVMKSGQSGMESNGALPHKDKRGQNL